MEHPTQAFLDLFTIREELGTVNGLTITFVGDLKFGRPVHSLAKLLQHYHVRIKFVSPPQLAMPPAIIEALKMSGMTIEEYTELTPDIVASSDVLYCTRVQKERFEDLAEFERLKNSFIIDNAVMKNAKSHMVVLHPLPRNAEIGEEVDFDQRAAYFRQVCSSLSGCSEGGANDFVDEIWIVLQDGVACVGYGVNMEMARGVECSVDGGFFLFRFS